MKAEQIEMLIKSITKDICRNESEDTFQTDGWLSYDNHIADEDDLYYNVRTVFEWGWDGDLYSMEITDLVVGKEYPAETDILTEEQRAYIIEQVSALFDKHYGHNGLSDRVMNEKITIPAGLSR